MSRPGALAVTTIRRSTFSRRIMLAPISRRTLSALGVTEALVDAAARLGRRHRRARRGRAQRRGAAVRPDDLQLFGTVANHAGVSLENHRLVDDVRDQAAVNAHQALHDALTGLPNRTMFERAADRATADVPVAVLMLDLDRFKDVNDALGHHHGDALLQDVAAGSRPPCATATWWPGSAATSSRSCCPASTAELPRPRGRRLLRVLERPFAVADVSVSVGASVGVVVAPARHRRDHAAAAGRRRPLRRQGRPVGCRVVRRRAATSHTAGRLGARRRAAAAIEASELDVHFQPQLDLRHRRGRRRRGAGALDAPDPGPHPAREFVPVAEHTGSSGRSPSFVLERALSHVADWRTEGHDLRGLGQPLAPQPAPGGAGRRRRPGCSHAIGVPPDALCLELTETSLMADPRRTLATLERLRAVGVAIAIDDFGTGYSSLAHLKRLPVDEIKVDKSFVALDARRPSDDAIVRSVIDLARNLGIRVVAEGVEDAADGRRPRPGSAATSARATSSAARCPPCASATGCAADPPPTAGNVLPFPVAATR